MADSSSYIETLSELQECLCDENSFEQALTLVNKLLNLSPNDEDLPPPTLLPTLQQVRFKLLLQLERFQDLLQCDNVPPSLEAYAYYRLHQYEKAKSIASSNIGKEDALAQHTLAQCLYRLHDYDALQVYRDLIPLITDEEELLQLKTNAMAVAAAHTIPFVSSDCVEMNEFIDSSINDNSDYLYNLATLEVLRGNTKRGSLLLQQARDACGDDPSDAAAIDVQLHEWSLLWNGNKSEATNDKLPEALAFICETNHANTLKKLPATCPSHWTALQQRLYHYKRAILQLQAKHYKDCKETISLLSKSLTTKKKNAPPPVSSDEEKEWWKTRLSVLEAHLLQQQGKSLQAVQLLNDTLQDLKKKRESSLAIDHAVAYCILHLFSLEHSDSEALSQEIIDLLEQLPASIQSSRAVTATLASLYQQVGSLEKATALLSQQDGGMAEYYMSIGDFEEAAKLLEGVEGKEAEYVVALSHVDPEKAQQVWDDLDIQEQDNELNGEELEEMDLPRFKSKRIALAATPTTDTSTSKPKRSQESILRRRARKREAYLEKNPSVQQKKLDPERWLPKYERSYYRKRRNARGAQGGGTQKDQAKLDVAARAAGNVMDSGPSTAHINVASSSGKKSGRRR